MTLLQQYIDNYKSSEIPEVREDAWRALMVYANMLGLTARDVSNIVNETKEPSNSFLDKGLTDYHMRNLL